MKSKTCLCNRTILWKDLVRFAPVMLGTSLLLWMVGYSYSSVYNLAADELTEIWYIEPVQIFLMFTSFLALVSAVCLFGYLTKKKECDAMHALPVRRETLFFTHALAALIQFAVPFAILYIFMPGNRGWFFQMGMTLCGWLFYFGLAVFSMMLAGRRLGGLMIFYLLGDLASSLWTMVDSLYIPQLPGLYLEEETMLTLSAASHMGSLDFSEGTLGSLLLPMGLYALGGLALLAVSVVIYRKRKLERAGDFLAEKWLEPVFAWGLGITAACIFVSLGYLMEVSVWIPLILGLAIGYFAARMLFARSVKVFDKKTLASFGALVGVMGASIFIVSMDPMGAVTRVPLPEQIESVMVQDYYQHAGYFYATRQEGFVSTDPEQLEAICSIHSELVQEEMVPSLSGEIYNFDQLFYLTYTLSNGSELRRCYTVTDEDHLAQIEYFLSQPESVLGVSDLETLLDCAWDLNSHGMGTDRIHTRKEFFTIFLADCENGNMYSVGEADMSIWSISVRIDSEDGSSQYVYIDIPSKAEATVAWLEEHFG